MAYIKVPGVDLGTGVDLDSRHKQACIDQDIGSRVIRRMMLETGVVRNWRCVVGKFDFYPFCHNTPTLLSRPAKKPKHPVADVSEFCGARQQFVHHLLTAAPPNLSRVQSDSLPRILSPALPQPHFLTVQSA